MGMRPGDLFVLRNAGNSCCTGSLIGSAEYAIEHLRCKLVVVMGHTQCGAVTAAVKGQKSGAQSVDDNSNIGQALKEIKVAAKEAVQTIPGASEVDQVKLATKLNIFDTMRMMI